MPISPATYSALLIATALAASSAFAADENAAADPPADDAASSYRIFTSWFAGRADAPAADATQSGQPTQPAADAPFAATAATRASELVGNALGLLGIHYRFGGNTPTSGFDCSGMVRYVFQNAIGLNLPRRAEEISRVGVKVARDDLKPGDLVFYKTLRRAFSHVGIYLGNNRFIHAPSAGGRVRVDDMSTSYWATRFNGARRVD
jgi:cell wall-associated NlpC family hydrolase